MNSLPTRTLKNTHLNILEIGASKGDFSYHLSILLNDLNLSHTIHIFELQPDDNLKSIASENIKVYCQSFSPAIVSNLSIDVVVLIEVLQHISNPVSFLTTLRGVVPKNCYFYILIPNSRSFELSFLKNSSNVIGFDHSNLFSQKSLSIALSKTGWAIESLTTPGLRDLSLLLEFFISKNQLFSFIRFNIFYKPLKSILQYLIVHFKYSSHMVCLSISIWFPWHKK